VCLIACDADRISRAARKGDMPVPFGRWRDESVGYGGGIVNETRSIAISHGQVGLIERGDFGGRSQERRLSRARQRLCRRAARRCW
jgi:hypothetical protein